MIAELERHLSILVKLNNQLEKSKRISQKEIDEEWDNIKDLHALQKKFNKWLNDLKNYQVNDNEKKFVKLGELYTLWGEFDWYIDQIDEMMRKLSVKYTKKINFIPESESEKWDLFLIPQFEETLKIMEKINEQLKKDKRLSQEEIDEAWNNLKNLYTSQKVSRGYLFSVLDEENEMHADEVNKTCSQLCYLDSELCDYEKRIAKLHNLVQKIRQRYGKCGKVDEKIGL